MASSLLDVVFACASKLARLQSNLFIMLRLPGAAAMITFNKNISRRGGKLKGFVVEKKKHENIALLELEKVRQKKS